MELDDLKQTWKETPLKKIENSSIVDLIQNKSYGPVAALKKAFRRQILAMSILPFLLILSNLSGASVVLRSIMFWSYVCFCIGVIIFSYFNYRIVQRMQSMDGMVKSNLERQIDLLETRLKGLVVGVRIALLFFIVLTEVVPYIQHYRMLEKWHSLPVFIRFGSYAVLLTIQYILNKKMLHRKFGGHLEYLKELVKEMKY